MIPRGRFERWIEIISYQLMMYFVRRWTNYMDQWEKFTVKDAYGNTVYVTFSYYDQYPDSFDFN